MRYYIIAGDVSADIHAKALIKSILQKHPKAIFRGVGSTHMEAAGATLYMPITAFPLMGIEALYNLKKIWENRKALCKDILQWKPHVVIYADALGHNLRLQRFIHQKGILSVFFIAPSQWAVYLPCIRCMRKYTDLILCIYPFEEEYYRLRNCKQAYYVGNPIASDKQLRTPRTKEENLIALLPGSRKKEVHYSAHILAKCCEILHQSHPHLRFEVPVMAHLPIQLYQPLKKLPNVKLSHEDSKIVLGRAYAAIISSGTATLEALYAHTPQIVIYKISKMEVLILKIIARIRKFSIVNILAGKEIIPELLQSRFRPPILAKELLKLLAGPQRKKMLAEYEKIIQTLGNKNTAEQSAQRIQTLMQKRLTT